MNYQARKERIAQMIHESETEEQHQNHTHGELIPVTVDGKEHKVPEGTYVVSDFKKLVGVDPSKALDEVIHGEFRPLDDTSKITIERHLTFVSHVRTGSSS